jgi:8-oxo-dGTP pyrophosphatase MutT (NUDIX family)
MPHASSAAVTPRPSATAIILRDSPHGIEAFMVVRHHEIDFASGALVFPGGKVDAHDGDALWTELASFSSRAVNPALFVAAARETFEEAGIVLARRRGTQAIVSAHDAHALVARHRASLMRGEITFGALIMQEGLLLATELMVPFAHWITPEGLPKRFDTHFLLVAAPVAQVGIHDGSESVEGLWIAPQRALDEAADGKRTLVFATAMNLRKLARYGTVAEAVEMTRAGTVVTVMPKVERTASGRKLVIPAEAGYGVSEVEMPARSR